MRQYYWLPKTPRAAAGIHFSCQLLSIPRLASSPPSTLFFRNNPLDLEIATSTATLGVVESYCAFLTDYFSIKSPKPICPHTQRCGITLRLRTNPRLNHDEPTRTTRSRFDGGYGYHCDFRSGPVDSQWRPGVAGEDGADAHWRRGGVQQRYVQEPGMTAWSRYAREETLIRITLC